MNFRKAGGSAKNQKDHQNLTEDGPADHHAQTTYFVGSLLSSAVKCGRTDHPNIGHQF